MEIGWDGRGELAEEIGAVVRRRRRRAGQDKTGQGTGLGVRDVPGGRDFQGSCGGWFHEGWEGMGVVVWGTRKGERWQVVRVRYRAAGRKEIKCAWQQQVRND